MFELQDAGAHLVVGVPGLRFGQAGAGDLGGAEGDPWQSAVFSPTVGAEKRVAGPAGVAGRDRRREGGGAAAEHDQVVVEPIVG